MPALAAGEPARSPSAIRRARFTAALLVVGL
jgi:hypothetical protein